MNCRMHKFPHSNIRRTLKFELLQSRQVMDGELGELLAWSEIDLASSSRSYPGDSSMISMASTDSPVSRVSLDTLAFDDMSFASADYLTSSFSGIYDQGIVRQDGVILVSRGNELQIIDEQRMDLGVQSKITTPQYLVAQSLDGDRLTDRKSVV